MYGYNLRRGYRPRDVNLLRGWFTINLNTGETRPAKNIGHAIACCRQHRTRTGKVEWHAIYRDDSGWYDVDWFTKEEVGVIEDLKLTV